MHMNYQTIEQLKDSDFKRLTGVQRETFEQMLHAFDLKGFYFIHGSHL